MIFNFGDLKALQLVFWLSAQIPCAENFQMLIVIRYIEPYHLNRKGAPMLQTLFSKLWKWYKIRNLGGRGGQLQNWNNASQARIIYLRRISRQFQILQSEIELCYTTSIQKTFIFPQGTRPSFFLKRKPLDICQICQVSNPASFTTNKQAMRAVNFLNSLHKTFMYEIHTKLLVFCYQKFSGKVINAVSKIAWT